MVTRLSAEAKQVLVTSAVAEARRRGDRRLGTEHLLLGLLHDAGSPAARALGVSLEAARAASDDLDLAALAAVGIRVDHAAIAPESAHSRRSPSLTSGARAVVARAVTEARPARRIETRHFLLALLSREGPDPAAELLRALGVDARAVRGRLARDGEAA